MAHTRLSRSARRVSVRPKTAEKFFNRKALDELLEGRGNDRGNTNRKLWVVYCFLTWYGIYFPEECA